MITLIPFTSSGSSLEELMTSYLCPSCRLPADTVRTDGQDAFTCSSQIQGSKKSGFHLLQSRACARITKQEKALEQAIRLAGNRAEAIRTNASAMADEMPELAACLQRYEAQRSQPELPPAEETEAEFQAHYQAFFGKPPYLSGTVEQAGDVVKDPEAERLTPGLIISCTKDDLRDFPHALIHQKIRITLEPTP